MNSKLSTQRTDEERARDRAELAEYDAERTRRNFDEAIGTILRRLENWKTDIERERTSPWNETSTKIAEQVQHTILWGLANLSLDDLTRRAHEADAAKRTAEAARKAAEGATRTTTNAEEVK